MADVYITTPVNDTDMLKLRIGDQVYISGTVYTARDAAHKRLVELLDRGETLPADLRGQAIYYVGPSPAKPGQAIGSAGPTTSYRMDAYAPRLMAEGLKIMIGKGSRAAEVKEAMIKHKAVYLAAVGGAAALIAKSVKKAEIVAYPELGPEALQRLEVENLPAIVVNDCYGGDLYEEGVKKYGL
ncbi:MAG: Fe-S-containing hydro-lyase [Bacillota bacterium]